VVVPESKPFRSTKSRSDSSPEASQDRSGNASGNLDESSALSSLKRLIATGDHRLDPMLGTIADAARQLTGASGAALAMWKDGAMVCRARSGKTAPALGAQLSADTGISGECLRTGKIQHCTDTEHNPLVDVEVCRTLGLRSIVVLPIQGWREMSGIVEVFSIQPAAFTESHIALLEQLAALAERARATQPHDASPTPPKLPSAIGKRQPSGLLPASDRLGDVAMTFIPSGRRSRALVLGAIGLVAISLLALVIWLGWSGADDGEAKAHAAVPAAIDAARVNPVSATFSDSHSANPHVPDRDRVWEANPGGKTLFSSGGKPSAGAPVKLASKVDVIAGKKNPADHSTAERSPARTDSADRGLDKAAAKAPTLQVASDLQSGLHRDAEPAGSSSHDSNSGDAVLSEPPPITARETNPSSLTTVLSVKASVPGLSVPVSMGVTGGQLLYRVVPAYPNQARQQRLQGTVVLAATITEDGRLGEIKVIKGQPLLARSAMDAAKDWRYQPFQLDGKPVRGETTITVDFKYPGLNH
jgi:TonB family protein